MDTLNKEELREVERAAQERLQQQAMLGYSPEDWGALQALLQAGLLTEIKPKRTNRVVEWPAITMTDKSLSETIVEERR